MYSQFKYQTYHIFFGWLVYVRGVFGTGGYCPAGICPGVYVRGVFVLEPYKCVQLSICYVVCGCVL